MGRPIVGVVGGGAWGVALAVAAARAGSTALLLSRREFPSLPEEVRLVRSDAEIGQQARLIVLAVPSAVARGVARSLGAFLDGRHFVVHGVRGLVPRDPSGTEDAGGSLETISDVVRDETPARRVGALGGPAVASDLVAGLPSVMVCGSRYPEVTQTFHDAFSAPALRVYRTHDLLGLEWASALVGCLAICVGYARGIGLGPGLLAAVITRAVEEGARLASAAGGEERTLLGLAGYGDLLASISQTERPEALVGEALAKGRGLDRAIADAGQRVEAVELTSRVVAWAAARDVKAPIFAALASGVLSGSGDALVRELMTESGE
jgi:glycerol-3-phosphate dehydrogenase (NAD(P)+)